MHKSYLGEPGLASHSTSDSGFLLMPIPESSESWVSAPMWATCIEFSASGLGLIQFQRMWAFADMNQSIGDLCFFLSLSLPSSHLFSSSCSALQIKLKEIKKNRIENSGLRTHKWQAAPCWGRGWPKGWEMGLGRANWASLGQQLPGGSCGSGQRPLISLLSLAGSFLHPLSLPST